MTFDTCGQQEKRCTLLLEEIDFLEQVEPNPD